LRSDNYHRDFSIMISFNSSGKARITRRRFMGLSVFGAGFIYSGLGFVRTGTHSSTRNPITEARMEKVKSKDGTDIAYWVGGEGPPLVLVHGTTADHTRWASVSPAFQEKFTVYAVDRRGRGESGDTLPYAIEREFEDIAAVVNAIPGPVNLLGHSYGAICSLGAALLTEAIAKLVLYEPPIPAGIDIYPPGAADRIQKLVDAGDRDGAVSTFFREIVKMPEHELALQRSLPIWKARVAAAHTIPREMMFDEQYKFSPERFRKVDVPALLLLGGDSPPFLKGATELVSQTLPHNRIAVMPGQQHTAMNTAPQLFTSEVLKFLLS
jgi:pimeloyl-ACP methyl ester carboxylesterase